MHTTFTDRTTDEETKVFNNGVINNQSLKLIKTLVSKPEYTCVARQTILLAFSRKLVQETGGNLFSTQGTS